MDNQYISMYVPVNIKYITVCNLHCFSYFSQNSSAKWVRAVEACSVPVSLKSKGELAMYICCNNGSCVIVEHNNCCVIVEHNNSIQ